MMLIDDFIERVDWKKMIFGGLAALVLFILLVAGFQIFFNHGPSVALKKSEFEYGETVVITDYIDSFDGEKIYPLNIKAPSILDLESRKVSFDPVNPKVLGDYPISYTVTDKVTGKSETFSLKIKIIDSTPPDLTVKENIETDLDSFGRLKATDLIEHVSDLFTATENITLAMVFNSKAELGKSITGSITATDSSGNSTSVPVIVKIKDYQFEKDDADQSQESSSASNKTEESQTPDNTETVTVPDNSIEQSESNSVPLTPSVPSAPSVPDPQPVQPVQKPSSQYFMFTDGYNMGNVESACSAAGDATGLPYACTPIADGDGIYTGMVLTFN